MMFSLFGSKDVGIIKSAMGKEVKYLETWKTNIPGLADKNLWIRSRDSSAVNRNNI
jgi:hypothetical protein